MTSDDKLGIAKILSLPAIGLLAGGLFDGSTTSQVIVGLLAMGVLFCVYGLQQAEVDMFKWRDVDKERNDFKDQMLSERLAIIERQLDQKMDKPY